MTQTFSFDIRVRYQETDQMGVVYHANYLNWFEVCRTEWFRNSGTDYRQLEKDGLLFPVIEANCKYIASAHYDDWIRVTTWVHSYNRVRMIFAYEVTRLPDHLLLATGSTTHVFVNRTGQIVRLEKTHPELQHYIASYTKTDDPPNR